MVGYKVEGSFSMANAGTLPDCVHCRHMLRQQNGEYRCRQHDMVLHSPVRVFCKHLAPPPVDDDAYTQWFTESIDTTQLEPNMLYMWVETITRDTKNKREAHIDSESVAPLTSYATWSAGTFWEVIRSIREAKREFYRQHGYDIED